ncbi:glycosyltransferase [Pseudazoarcus pumilus]|uniref:glycosyltransferase n=1 Tax=Pseudazoarcus pumilus TaxID=2067960 RepID=UPI0018F8B6F7|nr:glycosyltransferase [Pseudazoarcus pumilus]
MASLHIIASRQMGGAERWFARFLHAMQRAGEPVSALVRRDSELARHHLDGIAHAQAPMRTVWDPLSRHEVSRYARLSGAQVVQTYMSRATRLTRLARDSAQVHVARLGGYYGVHGFVHADAWVGNTRGLCDWMVRNGLPAERVFHIGNFVETARPADAAAVSALRGAHGIAADDWLIVHAARMVAVKDHANLLNAFARLPAEVAGRRPRLALLGDGPLRPALVARAAALGIASRIVWVGWQHDPGPWFHAADLMVFPSRDEETLGNVLLEAWSHRRPIVATAFRGARELARHGEDALIVPCGDAAALAHAIVELLGDSGLATRLIASGASRVADEFSEAIIIDRYRDLYARLTGSG